MMQDRDKRRHPRFDALNLLHFTLPGDYRPMIQGMGRTLNVSRTGILLETHVSMEAGQSIQLTIGIEEDLVIIEGQVVHCKPEPDGIYISGIDFRQMPQASQQVLERYIHLFKQR